MTGFEFDFCILEYSILQIYGNDFDHDPFQNYAI